MISINYANSQRSPHDGKTLLGTFEAEFTGAAKKPPVLVELSAADEPIRLRDGSSAILLGIVIGDDEFEDSAKLAGDHFRYTMQHVYSDTHIYDIGIDLKAQDNRVADPVLARVFLTVSSDNARFAEVIAQNSLVSLCDPFIQAHIATLARKKRQLVIKDDYGIMDGARWFAEVKMFARRVVMNDPRPPHRLREEFAREDSFIWTSLLDRIDAAIRRYERTAQPSPLSEVRTGVDYEHWCKAAFERAGWSVVTTATTGDQGADLIASRDSERLVVQCKFYSSPVGNQAVQEALSAREFYSGTRSAVISNNAFTPHARQLAQVAGVRLMHHDEIGGL